MNKSTALIVIGLCVLVNVVMLAINVAYHSPLWESMFSIVSGIYCSTLFGRILERDSR